MSSSVAVAAGAREQAAKANARRANRLRAIIGADDSPWPGPLQVQAPLFFDAELHPEGLSENDLDDLVHFGLAAALAAPLWDEAPRSADDLVRRWERLVERELPRLERHGVRAFAALGLPPGAPRLGLERAVHRLAAAFSERRVVALGPVELGRGGAADAHLVERQLELAREVGRPLIARLPLNARRPLQPFLTILDAGDAGHDRLLLLGPSRKVFRVLREVDRWQALRVGPRGLSPEAAAELVSGFGSERIVVASGAGRGGADLLALPKLAQELEERGLAGAVARRVLRENAAAFLRVTL